MDYLTSPILLTVSANHLRLCSTVRLTEYLENTDPVNVTQFFDESTMAR